MPMTALNGVRISWLMVATKALFACDPARAASCARRSSRVRSRTRSSSCSFACRSFSAPPAMAEERRASYAESSIVAVRMTKVNPPMV
jgi:hypothetical protein